MNDSFFDALQQASLPVVALQPRSKSTVPRHKAGERFLKGPIPMSWLAAAAQQNGKALAIGIALWHLAGLNSHATVRLSGTALRKLNVGRKAGYAGLAALESVGLVTVVRARGRCPQVTIQPKYDEPAQAGSSSTATEKPN